MLESKLHRFSNDHPLLKLPEVSNLVYLSDFNRQGYFQKILIEVCLLDTQSTTYKKAPKFLRFCEKKTYSHTSKHVSLNPSSFDSRCCANFAQSDAGTSWHSESEFRC